MRELDDAAISEVRKRIAPVLAKYQTEEGIAPPSAVWLVSAKA